MKRAMVIGQNVYLRPIESDDIDNGWLDWINDYAVNRNLASRLPVTREGLEQYWAASQPPQAVMFAICLQEDDTYIGNARLSDIDWVNRKCTSGQLIGEQRYRGRGFGSESLVLLFRYGFHELGDEPNLQCGHNGQPSRVGAQWQNWIEARRNSATRHFSQWQIFRFHWFRNAAVRIR